MTPLEVSFPKDGGSATCPVKASPQTCSWTAESTVDWLRITGGGSGTGNGNVRFQADKNETNARREGRIRLRENRSVHCEVTQTDENFDAVEADVSFSSELALAGGSGQVVMNGLSASFQGPGRRDVPARARRGENRIEATVVAAAGSPGTWRFELLGPLQPGSLRVLAGDALQVTPSAVVFRASGRPGERFVLTFQLAR
jgi:hypothetical protein